MATQVKVTSKLPKIATRLEREATESTERVARLVVVSAKARVPVRTGKTQSTIRVMGRATTGRGAYKRKVRVRFPGRLLEYGTKNMRARPFMVPAAKDVEDSFRREARRWFR